MKLTKKQLEILRDLVGPRPMPLHEVSNEDRKELHEILTFAVMDMDLEMDGDADETFEADDEKLWSAHRR